MIKEKYTTFHDTVISSPQWKLWYEEIMRRHLVNEKSGEWKDNKTFDIDESQECGWLGEAHFQEFLNFISAQAVQEALEKQKEQIKKVALRHPSKEQLAEVQSLSFLNGAVDMKQRILFEVESLGKEDR